jgi:hypothetical protein
MCLCAQLISFALMICSGKRQPYNFIQGATVARVYLSLRIYSRGVVLRLILQVRRLRPAGSPPSRRATRRRKSDGRAGAAGSEHIKPAVKPAFQAKEPSAEGVYEDPGVTPLSDSWPADPRPLAPVTAFALIAGLGNAGGFVTRSQRPG